MTAYSQDNTLPGTAEYCALRVRCGLSPRSEAAAQSGLPGSLFATVVRDQGKLIAMGRVVGDGGCNFEVVDIAVHPDYQRQGIGQRVMDAIMDYLHTSAPESAYVCLIADDHSPALYGKYGFRPTTPRSIGMALSIRHQGAR